ncbi:MAG: TOMM precursor leader peptide-binding protein [Actinobacteria bacterium]|nr:TOMM precursor leader peptide-binding protein [Actinomycetota bacterium]
MSATTVPERPLLKPWYRLAVLEEGILLEHGRTVVAFGGGATRTLLPALLPLLDGTRTISEIVAVVGSKVAKAVEQALRALAENDLLTEGPRLHEDGGSKRAVVESLAAVAAPGSTMSELAERLAAARVRLVGHGLVADPLARLLHLSGIGTVRRDSEPGEANNLVVVAAAATEHELNEAQNVRALALGETWVPIGEYDGRTISVGPLIVPRESACHRCLQLRRESTSGCGHDLARLRAVPSLAVPRPAALAVAAALAAEVVVRWIATRDPSLPGTLFTLETAPQFQVEAHVLLRVPRCSACSPTAAGIPQSPWHEARVG